MFFLKFLFYHIYCWQRRMDPNCNVLDSAIFAFSALLIVWIGSFVMLISQLIDMVFGGSCLAKINNDVFIVASIVICMLTLIIPYSILLYKRNYFNLLLSMHRLYKDEYPYYVPGILLKSFIFLLILIIIYGFRHGDIILP